MAVGFGKATASRGWHLHHLDLAAKPAASPNFGCIWAAQAQLCSGTPGHGEPRRDTVQPRGAEHPRERVGALGGGTNGQEGAESSLGKGADPQIGAKTPRDRFGGLPQKITLSFALRGELCLAPPIRGWEMSPPRNAGHFGEGKSHSSTSFCGDRAPWQRWTEGGEPRGERGAGLLGARGAHHPWDRAETSASPRNEKRRRVRAERRTVEGEKRGRAVPSCACAVPRGGSG